MRTMNRCAVPGEGDGRSPAALRRLRDGLPRVPEAKQRRARCWSGPWVSSEIDADWPRQAKGADACLQGV